MALIRVVFAGFVLVASAISGRADAPHILADIQTGDILSANRADERWYPASLTKLMTAYVTFRAISAGELQDGSPVEISALAARQPPSKMGYARGTRLRVDTAVKIILVKSANDVSVALAEGVAGSVEAFVERMNDEARRLGMINSRFTNPNGLHSQAQYTSARDMALLSARLYREYPQYRYILNSVALKTDKKLHYSYNLLLERFTGANGMKTGFVCASGYNMVASATRNNQTLVAVVLGRFSQSDRAIEAARLLKVGFRGGSATLGNLFDSQTGQGKPASSQRAEMCSEAAMKARYDPGAGQAVVKSEFLEERVKSDQILTISTGGIDAEPSAAFMARAFTPKGSVPLPEKRPDYVVRNVDGEVISSSLVLRGSLPVPSRRPIEQ